MQLENNGGTFLLKKYQPLMRGLLVLGLLLFSTRSTLALPGAGPNGNLFGFERPASYNPVPGVGFDQRLNEQVPLDLPFTDATGKTVQLKDYFGDKPVILSLAYYDCPMLCTLVLNGLVRTLRTLSFSAGKEFNVVTVSFDAREKPALAAEKRKTYLDAYRRPGAEEGWHFLTGDEDAIQRLTKAVGFRFSYDEKSNQFAHASGIIVLTPQGKLSRYFYGIEYAPRDVRLGLVEAAEGKIGSAIDQVLLLCFHYDPAGGKYSFMVVRGVQLTGLLTLLLLGSYIFTQVRRERRKSHSDATAPALSLRKG
jgi:protein SCO1/2